MENSIFYKKILLLATVQRTILEDIYIFTLYIAV